jgi:tetratricopeptide (TPR) repeat protein
MIAARVAIRMEKWRRAETDLGSALDLEPQRVEAWINRALVRKRLGDLQGAADDLDEAAALDPAGPAPLLLIRLLVDSGAPRKRIVEALCVLSESRPPADLESEDLAEVLMIAARAGAPECVTHWLEAGDLGGSAEIATAYLAATGTGELR